MLYRLEPTLIDKRNLYIAESPLNQINCKEKTYFAYTELEKNGILAEIGAKKSSITPNKKKQVNAENVIGLHSEVTAQPITETLETNYMPYAMSTNVSRAFPEIDGFKPSHRKLLYTMYKMGLLKGERQKSANIVGQTMKLNPHGDAAIYETMVRLATGNEATPCTRWACSRASARRAPTSWARP